MAIRRTATAGMVGDTSLYNIDGTCVTKSGFTKGVGFAVGIEKGADTVGAAASVDGYKVLTLPALDNVYGVLVRSHYESPRGVYGGAAASQFDYDIANVMTHGRIWMVTGLTTAPVAGSAVTLGSDGSATSGGTITTGWTFTGGYQAINAAEAQPGGPAGGYALAEVQVIQK